MNRNKIYRLGYFHTQQTVIFKKKRRYRKKTNKFSFLQLRETVLNDPQQKDYNVDELNQARFGHNSHIFLDLWPLIFCSDTNANPPRY